MHKTIVVIDTNILASSPRLRGQEWQSMSEHSSDWGVSMMVPEVVLMETVNVVRRRWEEVKKGAAALKVGDFGLSDDLSRMIEAIAGHIEKYPEFLVNRLSELGITVAKCPAVDHMEIARRASDRRAPYQEIKDKREIPKDGYRDTLIWLTTLNIAEDNPDATVWLVSENWKDFGPTQNNWTGPGKGERTDCPIQFHPQLKSELAERELKDRVNYVVSLGVLEQHFASQWQPIDGPALEALIEKVDRIELTRRVRELAKSLPIDPETVGYSGSGEVFAVRVRSFNNWAFDDGAGRPEDRWTVRFSVDVKADVITLMRIPTGSYDAAQRIVPLRLVGILTCTGGGNIADIAMSSIEAPPPAITSGSDEEVTAYESLARILVNIPGFDHGAMMQSLESGIMSAADRESRQLLQEAIRRIAVVPPNSLSVKPEGSGDQR
ncbi:PIN domain-containing protein [Nocardia sp. NPDC003963]